MIVIIDLALNVDEQESIEDAVESAKNQMRSMDFEDLLNTYMNYSIDAE